MEIGSVAVTGVPPFDHWAEAPKVTREDFMKRYGLDPSRRMIGYMGAGNRILPNEHEVLEHMRAEEVARGQRVERRREREDQHGHGRQERAGATRGSEAAAGAVPRERAGAGEEEDRPEGPCTAQEVGGRHRRPLRYTTANTTIQTTSTKCQ